MWTSQLSDASSAVWIRLSGMRSRSVFAQRHVDDVEPVIAGVRGRFRRSARTRTARPCASSSVPLLTKVTTPAARRQAPKALVHKSIAAALSRRRRRQPSINSSTSRRPVGMAARLFSTTLGAESRPPARGAPPCPRVTAAGVSTPVGSTLTRTTAVRMWASLTGRRQSQLDEHQRNVRTDHRRRPGPAVTPRLLVPSVGQHAKTSAYRELGGYQPLADTDALLDEVEAGGLLGRGGAAFPLAVKLRAVRDNGQLRGDLAAPSSSRMAKRANRLRSRTDGCCVTGRTWFSTVCDWPRRSWPPTAPTSMCPTRNRRAASKPRWRTGARRPRRHLTIERVRPWHPDTWPARRPPQSARSTAARPSRRTSHRVRSRRVSGTDPRSVSNVETLANLPYLQHHGSAVFRSQGTSGSPGTFLATITGAGRPPVLYELPHGLPFTELLALHGVSPDQVRGALMGGYFAGLLNRGVLETTPGSRDDARARQRAGLWRDLDHHR